MINRKKHTTYNKAAFTMIELVIVIVVLGILAVIAMPRLERDLRQDAADAILSDIRYTQHLALTDFKHRRGTPNWQKSFWRIGFNLCTGTDYYEFVGSDMDYLGGPIGNAEAAIDPANGNRMVWNNGACANGGDSLTSERIFISYKYGIDNVVGSASCPSEYVGFDHLGRPHTRFAGIGPIGAGSAENYNSYMNVQCTLTFTMSNDDIFAITIQPETGYAEIVNQVGS